MAGRDPSKDGAVVAIVTTSSPELEQLAMSFDQQQRLSAFVHPFLIKPSSRLRHVLRVPMVGKLAGPVLERRIAPAGIDARLVHSSAPISEVLRAMLSGKWPRVGRWLLGRRRRALAKVGARKARLSPVIIASHGAALASFQLAPLSTLKVLNMPSIHPRERIRIIDGEAARNPATAASMERDRPLEEALDDIDREFEIADLILVGSEFSKSTLVKWGVEASRIEVVPYGVDIDRFNLVRPSVEKDRFIVSYIGRVSQSKGISYLLDAYRRVRGPGTELHVTGTWQADAETFGARQPDIVVRNQVSRSELLTVLSASSVVVVPSLFEGMGLIVAESMASGLPVVVTDRGCSQIVTDGRDGFVVRAGDPEAIAEKLLALKNDETLRERMGRSARETARRYTWLQYCETVTSLIDQRLEDLRIRRTDGSGA